MRALTHDSTCLAASFLVGGTMIVNVRARVCYARAHSYALRVLVAVTATVSEPINATGIIVVASSCAC